MIDSLVLMLPILSLFAYDHLKMKFVAQYFDIVLLLKVLMLFIVSIFINNTFAVSFDYISTIIFSYTISSETLFIGSIVLLTAFSRKDISTPDKAMLYLIPFSSSLSMSLMMVIFYCALKYIYESKFSYLLVLLGALFCLFNSLEESKLVGYSLFAVFSYYFMFDKKVPNKIVSLLIICKVVENAYIDVSSESLYISIFSILAYMITMNKGDFEKKSVNLVSVVYLSILLISISFFNTIFLLTLIVLPLFVKKNKKYYVFDFKEDLNVYRGVVATVYIILFGSFVKYLSFVIANNENNPLVWISSIALIISFILYVYVAKLSVFRSNRKIEANLIITTLVGMIIYYSGFYKAVASEELLRELNYNMSFIFSSITLAFAVVTILYFVEKDEAKLRIVKKLINKIQITGFYTKTTIPTKNNTIEIDNNGFNQYAQRSSDLIDALGIKKEDSLIYFVLSSFLVFLILVRLLALSEIV